MTDQILTGRRVELRAIGPGDLAQVHAFAYTVSIVEPLDDLSALQAAHQASGFWSEAAGALAIVQRDSGRLLGTCQFYRGGPCIHGFELGYIIHDIADWGQGYGAEALQMFSDHLFAVRLAAHRHQLLIEVWNTRSWRLAERGGFVREGVMRASGLGAGVPADSFVYSRTRNDWEQAATSHNGPGGAAARTDPKLGASATRP